jgi:hypothetical protein
MKLCGPFHIPAAVSPPPPVPILQEARWALELVWALWRREDLFLLSGIEPKFLGCSAHSPLLYQLSYPTEQTYIKKVLHVNIGQKTCHHAGGVFCAFS